MTENIKRFMITGTGSGCGKTTVTCAILKALVNRKLKVASFKTGPDYIDPMFHSKIIGTSARNLDIFMCGEKTVKYLFAKTAKNADISVIEGVMGNYDGLGGNSDIGSANHLAKITSTPQILVVSTKGVSFSLVAMISGYLNFRQNNIKGVILNNTTQSTYKLLKPIIEDNLPIKVYGYLPPLKEAEIGSRHLGLITADEVTDLNKRLEILAENAEKCIDIDGIIILAQTYSNYICTDALNAVNLPQKPTRIAVAVDMAFCFYYEDNLDLLRLMGAEIIPFSPLKDKNLPENINALWLGGGYPEEYAKELSENLTMLQDIKEKVRKGLPTIAECGGFMYLNNTITNRIGEKYNMVGAIDTDCTMTDKLVRFGYVTLKANKDNILCKTNEEIATHEFHYSDSVNNGNDYTGTKSSGKTWQCVYATNTLFAGYPHIHLWGNIDFAINFYNNIAK